MATQSVRIPIELELRNTQSAINSLKSALAGVSKESGFYKTISKEIDAVDKKFKELSATASRPFKSVGSISSFENQFMRLGDRITEIGRSFSDLNFKDLDLKGIKNAEADFNKLSKQVADAQNKLNGINTKQMKSALADSTSGLEEVFNKLSGFDKGGNLLNVDSFEKTFASLSNKATQLSEQMTEAQSKLERLKASSSQTQTKLGFFDEAQKKIQQFVSGTDLSQEAFAKMLQPLASQAGMEPERFLDLLGLNKPGLYTGAADKIQKNLTAAIASSKNKLTNQSFKNQNEITGVESTIQGLQNYINVVTEAKRRLEELQNSSATKGQVQVAKGEYDQAVNELNNFIEACKRANPAMKGVEDSAGAIGSAMNGVPGKCAAATSEMNRFTDAANKMAQFKSRLAYFFSFYKVMGTVRNVVKNAAKSIKELDSVMTEISVVTSMTQKDLWEQMDTYKAIANEYAVTIKGVYEVSQLYYQQGLQTAQVMELTVETLKMAKIANLDYATATDYMTVAVRGFKMEISDAQRVTDVYSALAANTASNTEEIAIAMSKTASSADAVGSSFESTSAMIATMVAITREAPENIGSALKSIISRYGEMTSDPTKLVDSEGEEMSLNRVDTALKSVGITLQNAQGEFRDFDEVILELAQKWDTIDANAQRYIATIMAGNRQQSRFLALVGNYEQYAKALDIANNSEDASAQQVLKTMDSVESKITNVKTAWQSFYTSMGLENLFKGALDVITQIINNINKMSKFEAITTIFNLFNALKGLVMGIFSGISNEFSRIKNLAQDSMKPLQDTHNIKIEDGDAKKKIESIEQKLLEILQKELKLDTSAAKAKLKELGLEITGNMPQGTNLLKGYTASNAGTLATQAQGLNTSVFTASQLNSLYAGKDFGKVSKISGEFNRVFGAEAKNMGAALKSYTEQYLTQNNLKGINAEHAPKIIDGFINSLKTGAQEQEKSLAAILKANAERAQAEANMAKGTKNLATWVDNHSAGLRVASMALQTAGAAITTWALTLKDSSESDTEKSKTAAGIGSIFSGVGSAIGGALMGAKAGPIGMIVGAIASGAPALISGISQIIDGAKQTTIEKIANAQNELKDLQAEETKKKAKSSAYSNALNDLEKLKDAQYDSAEAAQAYKDKMNTLAESYPELVTSMDSAGNAIIEIDQLEQRLAEARLATAAATRETLEKELAITELNKKATEEAIASTSEFSQAALVTQNAVTSSNVYRIAEIEGTGEEYKKNFETEFINTIEVLKSVQAASGANMDVKNQRIDAELADGTILENVDLLHFLSMMEKVDGKWLYGGAGGQEIKYTEDFMNQISGQDVYYTSMPGAIDYSKIDRVTAENTGFVELYIKEVQEDLKEANIQLKDLYLEDEFDSIEKDLEDGRVDNIDALIEFYNVLLPNALQKKKEKEEDTIEKSLSTLSKGVAEEELADLVVEGKGEYKEIQSSYLGIFKTIGGNLIEEAWKNSNSDLSFDEWNDIQANIDSSLEPLKKLTLNDYEDLAKVWDNIGAYDPDELKKALGDLGLDQGIIDLISEFYKDSFDYSRELAHKQIVKSKIGNTSKLQDLTNTFGKLQAPAELMNDINDTVQAADALYSQGYTARAQDLISIAETYYENATKLDIKDYLEIRTIIDDLDLTNIEDLTDARTAIEALNSENQYDDLLKSIDDAIKNCSQNIDALAQKVVSNAIAAIEKISSTIDGFDSGFGAKEALEEYKKLEGYKDLLDGKSFEDFFEYNDALGKWVYTNQGLSNILTAQTKQVEEDNQEIAELIKKSEESVFGLARRDFSRETGYVKGSKDYYNEDTETYSDYWNQLSAEEQAYREWASNLQKTEGLGADISKQAYIDYLTEQGEAGQEAAKLMWEQLIYSLGDTLDLEQIVTGALGDGADREKTITTIEEMISANGKNLYDQFGKSIAEKALLALEEGRFSDYELWTGDKLSPEEVTNLVTKKATALNDAVLKAIEAPGTVIDEATYNILAEAGLASHIKWDEQGFGIVTDAATDYVAMIEAIASQGGAILEEQNSTLASLYEKSFGADKAKTLSGLSSKSNLTFSDLADLATAQEKTLSSFFDENTGEINLSGLTYNDFLGEFEVTDFDAYWTAVTGSLDRKTAEYLEAYSKWINDQIDDSNKTAKEAQTQLDNLLDANIGDKVNVSYLESIAPNISDYLGTIVDGVATITDSSNLLGLLQYVTQLDAESNILENSVGELRDSIVELIKGWADAISSGLKGELDFTDAESLMTQFGLTDADFSQTKNGLKLSKDAAYDLYKQLKQIAPIQAELVFDSIAESLTEAGSGYEDVASTMETIAKLNEKLANVPVDSSRREELERELEVAEEILRVRSQDPESFNFMDKDLPTGMQGPENYWNSVGEAYKTMNESAKSGYMEIQDYVNIVNQMEAMAIAAGQEFSIGGMNAAQLIEKGMSSLKNIDGEGVKIAMEGVGIDFANAATDMGLSFDDGVKEVAKSQIKMLDAAIRILEAMVALEELDIDGSGMLEMDEIFINGDPGQGFTRGAQEWLRKINLACGDLKIGGKTLEETMLALAKTNPDKFLDFINQMTNIDWTLGDTNVAAQIENLINTFFPGEIVSMGKSIFDILEIPEDVEETPEKLAKWAESVGLAVGEARALLSNLEYGSTISQDSNQYEAIKKSLGLDKNDQLSQDFDNFYKTITGKGLNTREAIQLWEEITVSDGTEGTKYTYNGITYNTLDDVLVAKQLKETEGISGEVSNTTADTTTGEMTSELSLGQTTITVTQSESGTIYRSADGTCESNNLRKVIDYEVYQKTKETPEMSKVEAYAEFGIDLTAEGLANVSVEGIKETLSSTAIGDAVKKAGGTEDIVIPIDGKDVTFAAGTSETEIQQKLMEAIGIDASQVETIVTAITTAISTADWSKVGEAIKTALTTKVGQGENGVEAIEIGELTLKPTALKIDTTGIQPTLGDGLAGTAETPIGIGDIGVVSGTASGLKITSIPSEGTYSPEGEESTGKITITNGIPNAEGEVTTITLTPVANATSSVSGDVPAANVPTVTINGTTYTVDVTKAKQTAENAVMGLTGVKAGKADVEATSYTVTFTDANGTAQTVVVQGEAQLAATLLGATNVDGVWQLANVTGQADLSISETSKKGLVTFFDELLNKLKNIEITYQDPEPVNTKTSGTYNAQVQVGSDLEYRKDTSLDGLIEQLKTLVQAGRAPEDTYTIEKIDANGAVIETTTVEVDSNGATVTSTSTTVEGGTTNTPTPTPTATPTPETPTLDTSSMVADMQSAATEMASSMESGASTGATNAASKIQASLDEIEPPVIEIEKPDTVKIGIEATAKVRVEVTGDATASASITGTKVKAKGNVALAKGGLAAASGRGTLMGELGPELVVSNGRYFTVGNNGAEFVDLPDDAIVFNHLQTQKLLGSGKGMVGTGKPVTNEKKATALAGGNVSGPAMASAKDALAQLRQIRAMWQSMLDASAKDLGSKAGGGSGGGGGGGGGGDEEDLAAYIHDLERWYNLLRQIEKWEQKITFEQARRQNLQSGYDYSKSLQNELRMLKKQKAAYQELADLQRSYYDKRREDLLSTDYSKIFTYDEDGLMQYVDGQNRGLDILATLNEKDANGKAKMNSKQQIAYLKKLGFNTEQFRIKGDGTKLKSNDYGGMMEVFWEGIDTWMEELDGLYDSVNEHLTNVEENQAAQLEILGEYTENQLSLEQLLLTAITDKEQAKIDKLQDNLDALEEASSNYIKGLTDALNKEQEMYKQNQEDTETQKLQKQLAILQRSGGSASEIKSLQEQLDARMQDDYFNQQQQQIDEIQAASDLQNEKLQQQIDIATEALEYQKKNGLFWDEILTMMNKWSVEDIASYISDFTLEFESISPLDFQEQMAEIRKSIEMYKDFINNVQVDDDELDSRAQEAWKNAGFDEEYQALYEEAYKNATGSHEERAAKASEAVNKRINEQLAAEKEEQNYRDYITEKENAILGGDSDQYELQKKALEILNKAGVDKNKTIAAQKAGTFTQEELDMLAQAGYDVNGKSKVSALRTSASNKINADSENLFRTYTGKRDTYENASAAKDELSGLLEQYTEDYGANSSQVALIKAALSGKLTTTNKTDLIKLLKSNGYAEDSNLITMLNRVGNKSNITTLTNNDKKAQDTALTALKKRAQTDYNVADYLFSQTAEGKKVYEQTKDAEADSDLYGATPMYSTAQKTNVYTNEALSKGKVTLNQGSPIQILGFLGEKQPFGSDKVKFKAYNSNGVLTTYFASAKGLFGDGDPGERAWLLKRKQLTALNNNTFPQFAKGGLVDFTGPAWVDGTKSKPEAFLSAKDTALLKSKIFSDSDYSLRSVIEAIQGMSNSFGTINNSSVSGGITIENVTVEVQPGVISSDYDARRAGEMALEEIVKVARRSTNLNAMRR